MNIGTTIKKLRRERDITQEQLAEFLNISVSAVSQWESNKTAPDISTLPLLANIFEVSADVLLGIDVDSKERKIEEIFKSACEIAANGHHHEAVEILRKGLVQFPTSYKLMNMLAVQVYNYIGTETEEERTEQVREVVEICQKVLDGCTDNYIPNDAVSLVCQIYPKIGRREEALKIAASVPNYGYSSNELYTSIYKGTERLNQEKLNIMELGCLLTSTLNSVLYSFNDDGTRAFTADERLQICDKGIKIYEILYEDGDYFSYAQFLYIFNSTMLGIYSKQNDIEHTLKHIEAAAKNAIMLDTCDYNLPHTSLLSRGTVSGGLIRHKENFSWSSDMLQNLSDNQYDFIRADPRFTAVEEELKKIL